MTGLGILILVVLFIWIVWPYIARWLKRKAIERAEDYMRAQMGMPPRDKKSRRKSQEDETFSREGRQRRNPFGQDRYGAEPLIPKEYAEDVEFVETKDYSETELREKRAHTETYYHESQISDAEWTEVKKPGSK
ncbi:MAG: hypothetical protein J1D77_06595 [Muribaculaceae bacterium]|nr:hypothetical protein [Muribaculaceae bacterium]